ncbi:hypothetical protein GUJ93_ZPchr0006g42892 [Zizania palustris]|uniref:Uncharacterized protein n=1 Tax=Zizania palustris TaxID=103762 RepID=A0A8J5VTY0_ZIZPA|nr:hypothetical protein GUJ93_ZPchr0006g42892 [Zizania palustris]
MFVLQVGLEQSSVALSHTPYYLHGFTNITITRLREAPFRAFSLISCHIPATFSFGNIRLSEQITVIIGALLTTRRCLMRRGEHTFSQ